MIDIQDVRRLYELLEARRKEYGDRIWETAKYFTTIFSALLSVSVGAIFYLRTEHFQNVVQSKILISALLFITVAIAFIGLINVYREYKRMIEVISTLGRWKNTLVFFL